MTDAEADVVFRESYALNADDKPHSYANRKVNAVIYLGASIDGTWTEQDFADLTLAAADQAGVSAMHQSRINELVGLDVPNEEDTSNA